MRLLKLLESNNGWVCSDTECNFKHHAISEGRFLVSSKYFPEKGLDLDYRHTNILLFQRSFLNADSELHHQCLLAFKAPASDYPETQAMPCRHKCRLWVMVLHVLEHRTWNWAGEHGSKTSHKHRAYILELGFYIKDRSSLIPATPVLISGQLVSQTAFSSFLVWFFKHQNDLQLHLYWEFFSNTWQAQSACVWTEILCLFSSDHCRSMYFSSLNCNVFYHVLLMM